MNSIVILILVMKILCEILELCCELVEDIYCKFCYNRKKKKVIFFRFRGKLIICIIYFVDCGLLNSCNRKYFVDKILIFMLIYKKFY